MAQQSLDCRNLNCPMPIVQIAKAIRGLAVGDELTIQATDPAFEADVAAWSRKTGHELLSFERAADQTQRAVVRKRA